MSFKSYVTLSPNIVQYSPAVLCKVFGLCTSVKVKVLGIFLLE